MTKESTSQHLDVLLVEDNSDQVELISFLLKKIGINKIRVAYNYKEAVQKFQDSVPDIALIDIILPNSPSGIEVAKSFNKIQRIPIVFITGNYFDELYEEAKTVLPYAFIDKQLSELKLKQTIELAILHFPEKDAEVTSLFKMQTSHNPDFFIDSQSASHFFVKIGNHLKKIKFTEILYFEVNQNYTIAFLENRTIPIRLPLKELAKRLKHQHFTRIHKSYMINTNEIDSIDTVNNELFLNGKKFPIGRSFKPTLLSEISTM